MDSSTHLKQTYLKQTPYSDPGDLDVSGLSRDPAQLARIVRNLIFHRLEGERLGWAVPEQRLHEDGESRYVREMLRILRERSGAPLTELRSHEEQFVGTCRDYALLHVSLLRATGTPARVRGGFATYFVDGFHEDHWVTEYLSADGSWRLIDPQVLHPAYAVDFDPLDVPRDRFAVAGEAWRAVRAGEADPRTFGFWSDGRYRGTEFVRHSLVLDLACRNGVETLPWDGWLPLAGLDDAPGALSADDLALLDAVAACTSDEEARRLYDDPRLTAPRQILSQAPYLGLRTVTLP